MSDATAPVGRWFKSSRSANNAQCVEIKFDASVRDWFKSSRSSSNPYCVEVRFADAIGVRDSKDRSGPSLAVSPYAWRTFVAVLRTGAYDA